MRSRDSQTNSWTNHCVEHKAQFKAGRQSYEQLTYVHTYILYVQVLQSRTSPRRPDSNINLSDCLVCEETVIVREVGFQIFVECQPNHKVQY